MFLLLMELKTKNKTKPKKSEKIETRRKDSNEKICLQEFIPDLLLMAYYLFYF